MSGWWRHTCVTCGALFHGSRCRIVCPSCYALHAAKARGRCLVCGARVKPRFLFCSDCRARRHEESVRRSEKLHGSWERNRQAEARGVVVTASYEEVSDGGD